MISPSFTYPTAPSTAMPVSCSVLEFEPRAAPRGDCTVAHVDMCTCAHHHMCACGERGTMSRFANLADKPVVCGPECQIRWNRRSACLPNCSLSGWAQSHLRLLHPEMSLALHLCARRASVSLQAYGRGVQ
jgi:hypothetical protein